MPEYLGIVCSDHLWGVSLLLQKYEGFYYLRVEDREGAPLLKCRLSLENQVTKSYEGIPEDSDDFRYLRWAQDMIANQTQQQEAPCQMT